MQETWVRSLGWEDALEEGMATHSSILAWRTPMDRGSWRAVVHMEFCLWDGGDVFKNQAKGHATGAMPIYFSQIKSV